VDECNKKYLKIIFGLFDNLHDLWNIHHIKNVGLLIALFTWVQSKVGVQNLVDRENREDF